MRVLCVCVYTGVLKCYLEEEKKGVFEMNPHEPTFRFLKITDQLMFYQKSDIDF